MNGKQPATVAQLWWNNEWLTGSLQTWGTAQDPYFQWGSGEGLSGVALVFPVSIRLTDALGETITDSSILPLSPGATTQGTVQFQCGFGGAVGPTQSRSPLPGPWNYTFHDLLHKSLLFFEAQKSGPSISVGSDRFAWRVDSTMTDGADVGVDLTGGFFDAGDHVKFGFPMAFSVTNLAFGFVLWPTAFTSTGEDAYLLETIKWATDYFLKCHVSANAFYGQVGTGETDHAFWGPPELFSGSNGLPRPSAMCSSTCACSDLVAETAAALAASSIVFKRYNATYASILLSHARTLFSFANTYQGTYTNCITDAESFYASSGYTDELTWAAAWIARASGVPADVTTAVNLWSQYNFAVSSWGYSWDNKYAGAAFLLWNMTSSATYGNWMQQYITAWLPGGSVPYTPGGLAYIQPWGPLSFAMGASLLTMAYADSLASPPASYMNFAHSQIMYVTGQSNPRKMSYVVGYGPSPPWNIHHRGSHHSTTNDINNPVNNVYQLVGAMVGGPDSSDGFQNLRTNYQQSEPTCNYNSVLVPVAARMFLKYG